MKQHYVQLAEKFVKMPVSDCWDWYTSEKLDGQRAIWDGGISRGMPITSVHHANTSNDRHTDYLATGLWSRYGKVIHAPDWFLDQLPKDSEWGCDLELWGGYNNFQWTTGVVRSKRKRDRDWRRVTACIFDRIPLSNFLEPRFVNVPTAIFRVTGTATAQDKTIFADRLVNLAKIKPAPNLTVIDHQLLSKPSICKYLNIVVERGGEGLMLRSPDDIWVPERVKSLRKWKPTYYSLGTVVGETPGKGKYEGLVGALIIESKEHGRFQMSGMTDKQRFPGTFPVGSTINFKFDGLTTDGLPRNVRYNPL